MPEFRNSDMRLAIEEYVHNSKHRELLRLRYCDGYTYEEIAWRTDYSPQHVKAVCREYKNLLISRL